MNRDNDFNTLTMAELLVSVMQQNAETVATLRAEAERVHAAKEAKAGIDADTSGLWGYCRQLAEVCDAATIDHENVTLTRAVFAGVMSSVKGEAADTVKVYASTAGKLIEQVRSGRLAWATLPEAYGDIRKAMKPDHKKQLDEKAAKLVKAVKSIKRHKLPTKASEALDALIAQAEAFALQADASREDAKKSAQNAKKIDDLRQQHPSAPATVEVSAAA